MSEWFKRLIAKHTFECVGCKKKVDKQEAYTIQMDTADGPHEVKMCQGCAMEFDEVLKEIEEIKNAGI